MQRYLKIGGFVLTAAFVGLGYYLFGLRDKSGYTEITVILGEQTFKIDVADTQLKQAQGLSYRESMAEDRGMLFVFPTEMMQTFWMKDMNFPIDIIWIKGDTVAGFAESASPEPGKTLFQLTRYSSPEPVDRVLEVAAGTVARAGIKVGDKLTISGL